jgi:multiple sugar transport system substrate-binding protein
MRILAAAAFAGLSLLGAVSAQAEKLVIAGRDGAYASALKTAVEQYKAKNPGLEIERLELTGGGLLEKVTIAMREKSGAYDVIMLDDPWAVEFMGKRWLADLDKLGGGVSDDFVKPARDVSRHPYGTGTHYAVPFVGNVEMFAYRKDLFDKHGLARPASWTAVLDAAKTISAKEPGVSGVVFRGKKGNPIVTGFMPILWAHGGNVVGPDGKASLDSEAGLKALNLWLALKPYAPKGVETYDATEVRDALMQGTTAMTIELWPAWAPSLDEADKSKVPGKIEIMPAPGETSGPAPMLGSWLVAIPADSKNQAKARDFIDFLTSAEMQKKLALEAGSPPTRISVYQDAEVTGKYRWYKAQLAALVASQPRPRIAEWGKVETILGDYLQLALIGQMEPKKALAEANEKIARALKP